MGYEVKMYVVEPGVASEYTFVKYGNRWTHLWMKDTDPTAYAADGTRLDLKGDEPQLDKTYCAVIGMVDLCKVGSGFPRGVITDFFFYAEDGNTPVIEDRYSSQLSQMSVEDMITFLKSNKEDYRRYHTALALLEGVVGLYKDPVVLLYGH